MSRRHALVAAFLTGKRARRAIRAVLGTVLVATTAVGFGFPVVSSEAKEAADGIHWVLHPQAVAVTHDGVSYRLRMWVSDGSWSGDGGGDPGEREQAIWLIVSARTRAGRQTHAVQRQYYTFSIDHPRQPGFSHPAAMNTATLRAWDRYGHFRIRLTFAASAAPAGSCDGHTVTRPGRLSGSMFFRPPHSRLGAITRVATQATLTHGDGTCTLGTGPRPQFTSGTPCPMKTYAATGQASPSWAPLTFVARRDPGSDIATITLATTTTAANPRVWRTLDATLPANHVNIASDLSSISITGIRGSYLSGTARAAASGPPTPWTARAGCPSDTSVEASLEADNGTYVGSFTAHFLLGGPASISDLTVKATAFEDVQQR